MPRIIQRCRAPGPLAFSALSEEELALLDALMARLYKCAEAAAAVSALRLLTKSYVALVLLPCLTCGIAYVRVFGVA